MSLTMSIQRPLITCLRSYRNIFNYRPIIYQQQNVGLKMETRNKLEQLKIPEKPKRPMSPYLKFATEHRRKLLKENPELNFVDVAKKCSNLWNEMQKSAKERYSGDYEEQMLHYDKAMKLYNAKLTEEQKQFLKALSEEKKHDKNIRHIRKRAKETSKPKKPMSAYSRFVMEKASAENKKFKVMLSECKKQWEELPKHEKEKYHNEYISEKIKYDTELADWEQMMIAQGNLDVVRLSSLPPIEKATHISRAKTTKNE